MTSMVYLVHHSFVAILFAVIMLAGCASDQGASEQNDASEQETSDQEAAEQAALEEETAPPPPEAAESPPLEREPAGRVVEVGDSPAGVASDPETGLVAVGLSEPDRLALVDGSTGEVIRETELSASPRHLKVAGPGGPVLVPAEGSWTLIQVSLPEGEVVSEIPVGAVPHDAAAGPDGRIFVINEFSESVSVIEDDEYLDTIQGAPLQLGGVDVTQSGMVGVVGVRGLDLEAYDASTLESLGRVDAGEGPTHIRAGPDNRFYVIDTRGEAVLIYATEDGPEQVGSVSLPGEPYGVAIDPERGHLWVTLTAKNELVQLALEEDSLRELARYPTVRQPNTVAVDSASGRVYVTGGADGELQILDPRSG